MRNKRSINSNLYVTFASLLMCAGALYCASLAQGPDREFTIVDEVKTDLDSQLLEKSVFAVINWPSWHSDPRDGKLLDIKLIDIRGIPYAMNEQTLAPGALVRFSAESSGPSGTKKWETFATVVSYQPGRLLELRFTGDSRGHTQRLFAVFGWRLDYGDNKRIHSEIYGRTSHWSSRLLAPIWPRKLLNSLVSPDIRKLARLKQPLDVTPTPPSRR